MKELISEDQANLIILALSILISVGSAAYGFYQTSKTQKALRKLLWLYTAFGVLLGPVIWIFWQVYNSIENFYGLDSVKALKINFFIAVSLGAVFYALFYFAPRWAQQPKTVSRRRK